MGKSTDYCMSKHAVLGLMRSASVQLGVHGIRVNCVSPNGMATPLTCKASGMEMAELQKAYEKFARLRGVVLKAEHVAKAVLFLASDDSEFVTGHDLNLAGRSLIRTTKGRSNYHNYGIVASSNVGAPLWEAWKPDKASSAPSLSDVLWPSAG
ncbi:hypothetical protein J5N97_000247 [Dioscorea zingiberensis]|uniref:Uncharacterized protein n=1 Tax=Dioscorea zingiberensis TaxID=325984 RepID=A0A9D5BSP9_9LILI|nr:hypothetical protein J5N97_000247 [Dioscorea zingiberensis]